LGPPPKTVLLTNFWWKSFISTHGFTCSLCMR